MNIRIAWNAGLIHGIKYYPKGGTTASDKGLIGFREVSNILELMQELGIPLLIHGETPVLNGDVVDDYEREMIFIESELVSLVHEFPELPVLHNLYLHMKRSEQPLRRSTVCLIEGVYSMG
jgi:dihydroorotase